MSFNHTEILLTQIAHISSAVTRSLLDRTGEGLDDSSLNLEVVLRRLQDNGAGRTRSSLANDER